MKRKNEKGITLIALVITIIILLILAGVSILTLTGENGILRRAKTATETTKIASAKEEIELAIIDEMLRANSENNEFNYDNVWNELRKKDSNMSVTPNATENNYTVVYKGYNFLVDNQIVTHIEGPVDPSQTTSELTPLGEVTIDGITYTQSYDIWNKGQLETFRNKVNDGETFENCILRQKANINLNNENWKPIGDKANSKPFSGTFDAEGKTTRGLNINEQKCYQGLFGYVKEGIIKRLTVEGSVTAGAGSAGVIACIEGGTIENCTNKASVSNTNDSIYLSYINSQSIITGGVCGLVEGETRIIDSSNEGNIKCNVEVCDSTISGGVIGFINEKGINTSVEKCSNSGEIKINSLTTTGQTALPVVGGIIGGMWEGRISKCNNTGKVYSIEANNITNSVAYNTAGGIVGSSVNIRKSADNKIEQCWNKGEIENTLAGGIVGLSGDYTIDNCYNAGIVKSNYKCGVSTGYSPTGAGICGSGTGVISNSYNKGEVENNGCGFLASNVLCGNAGGIVGANQIGSVLNCYNKGTIKALPSAEDQRGCAVGGIVGLNYGNVINAYNEGNITTNGNSTVCLGGVVSWEYSVDQTRNVSYVYNIGNLTGNAVLKGGVLGLSSSNKALWSNFCWLEGTGAIHSLGSATGEDPTKYTSEQIKGLISSGGLPDTDWAIDSNINTGYPHLKAFDNTNIWLRDSDVNDGDPYLKENLPK